jgi:hypothetical protein
MKRRGHRWRHRLSSQGKRRLPSLGTARLCEHYARDERVGELLKGERLLRKQAEPLVQALTRAIMAFYE